MGRGWRGKRGNPVLFARRFFAKMRAISGDVGARALIGDYPELVCELPMADEIFLVVTATVMLSVLVHGLSAVPASNRFGDWFEHHTSGHMAETEAVDEMPTR